jgi:hypothetical protein
MKVFSMSMYGTKEQLLQAKVEYLEERNMILLNRLHRSKRRNREDKLRINNALKYFIADRDRIHDIYQRLKQIWFGGEQCQN